VSPETALRNAGIRGGRPTAGGFGAVDVARFCEAPPDPGVRKELGLGDDDRVVGIVARAQPHRRFDLLLEAARRLFDRDARARLLVVGRGTRRASVVEEPARRLGLQDRIVFAGYRRADYADVLRAIDVFSLLVPGSDGTCRAVLEAAACGIPAVVLGRGALPEIVADGETGFVVDDDPDALAEAWGRLLGDAALRAELGCAARRRAESLFASGPMAEGVEALYREVLERV
jgi:glycosyltransferase involved in cell wall biosynthesis